LACWKRLYEWLSITCKLGTAHHLQTYKQTKKIDTSPEPYLQAYVNYKQDTWSSFLPVAECCHDNTKSSSTKVTPFYVVYRTHLRIDIIRRTKDSLTEEFMADWLQNFLEKLQAAIMRAQE
jgi:hypothetical protein